MSWAVLEGRQPGILCYLGQATSLSKAQSPGMPSISALLGLLLCHGKRGSADTRMKLNSGFHHYFSRLRSGVQGGTTVENAFLIRLGFLIS